MAYVDLNPVRAKMAKTPEASEHTSIKERITPTLDRESENNNQSLSHIKPLTKPLLHFDGNTTSEEQTGIPFSLPDYLTLVDWTGRIIRKDKRGSINHKLPPILERLSIDSTQWIKNSTQFEVRYQRQFQRQRKKAT